MSKVFILDTMQKPLDPVHPGLARRLLSTGQAAVFRRYPFTIILKKEVEEPLTQPLRLKLDPGSKTTGIAIVNDASGEVVWAAELAHRGQAITKKLDERRRVRHGRRQRETRYRQPRFDNRQRKQGWLPPSLESRIHNILTWVNRLAKYCLITAISQELVKFDMALMQNAEISGIEYQQGDLQGYELREYLLEKWERECAYCAKKEVPLQIEHIVCQHHGGSSRVSNLTLACEPCNLKKGTQDIRVFLKNKPDVLQHILAHAKAPLKDAAAVNTTRWVLYERLKATSLPVETGTGGRTKYNRLIQGLDKAHWIDAACVGVSTPNTLLIERIHPLLITATGHGNRQMCLMNPRGFPRTKSKKAKVVKGFQTGDMVKAVVTSGKKVGTYVGRVAVRLTGSFNVTTKRHGTVEGISYRACTTLHKTDGYSYSM